MQPDPRSDSSQFINVSFIVSRFGKGAGLKVNFLFSIHLHPLTSQQRGKNPATKSCSKGFPVQLKSNWGELNVGEHEKQK
jgi:hypothetical protein